MNWRNTIIRMEELLKKESLTDNGFDPCFAICCGKYILKYEYVK